MTWELALTWELVGEVVLLWTVGGLSVTWLVDGCLTRFGALDTAECGTENIGTK